MCISPNFNRPAIQARDKGLKDMLQNISKHIARTNRATSSRTSMIEVTSLSVISIPFSKKENQGYGWTANSKSTCRKRGVSFSDKVSVKFTKNLQEFSPQEVNATWYSTEEYEAITQSCCHQIEKLDRGERLKGKKFCARGLECHTRTRSLAKNLNRSLAYQAVLDEQHRQTQAGTPYDEDIARVYHAVSSSCQLWANIVALEDQRTAQYLHDAEDYSEENSTLNVDTASNTNAPLLRRRKGIIVTKKLSL